MSKYTRYLVGGAVRDQLLGLPVTERDWVVVGATPEIMLADGFRPVGQDFPVFIEPGSGDEYALARTERKSGKGYGGFTFHASPDVTLEEDLLRRDLTVNAMAMAEDGALIDPYGGERDLKARILRHVSPAFAEDPLRVLRVARFAARYAGLGFRVADETLALMRQLAESGELSALTAERSWKEISRALMEPHPAIFIQVLRDCGALQRLFPELEKLFGISLPDYRGADAGEHQLRTLAQAAAMALTLPARWACLLKHLGRGSAPARGSQGVRRVNERCKAPRDCQELSLLASQYLEEYRRAQELGCEALMDLFKAFDIYRRPERLSVFLQVCEADARAADYDCSAHTAFLRGAAEAARGVAVQPLIEQGFGGAELGQALERQRCEAVQAYQELTRDKVNAP